MTRLKNHALIYSTLVIAVLIGLVIGSLIAYDKFYANKTSNPVSNATTSKFSGKITYVLDGRPVDGDCYIKVNNKDIIIEPSGQSLSPDDLNGPFGQLIVDGQTQDAKCEDVAKYKGRSVEVYASDIKNDDNTYLSIYGNSDYYIKIDP